MRRVNFKFLAALVLCLLLIAGGVHALHVYQYANHTVALKKLVDDSKSSSNTTLRIENLRRYVAIARDDAESLAELGDLLVESNRLREAQLSLSTALNLFEAQGQTDKVVEIRRTLADIAIRSGKLGDAEFQLDNLIVPLDGETDGVALADIDDKDRLAQAEYRELLARVRIAQFRWADANVELGHAIDLDASRCDSYALRADVQADKLEQYPAAVATLATMVEQNPAVTRAHFIRGAFRVRKILLGKRDAEAAPLLAVLQAEAAQNASSEAAAAGTVPEPLSTSQLLGLATVDAQRALELAPDDQDVLLLAMQCAHLYRDAPDRAVAEAQMAAAGEYARRIIDNCEVRFAAEQANAEAQLRSRWEAEVEKRNALGETVADVDEAAATSLSAAELQKLRAMVFLPAVSAFNISADVAMFQNKPAEAMHALTEGLENVEFDESLLLNLASLRITRPKGDAAAAGQQDEELSRLILQLQRRPESAPLAAFLEARRMATTSPSEAAVTALHEARKNLERWPEAQAETDMTLGELQLMLDRPAAAEGSFERALDVRPNSIPAMLGLGRALQAQGNKDDIEKSLQIYGELLQRQSEFTIPTQYSELAVRLVQTLRVRNAGLPADDPAWTPVLEILARLRAQSGDGEDAALLIDMLDVDIMMARGLIADAEARLQDCVARYPQSSRAWAALALIQDRVWLVAAQAAASDAEAQAIPNRAAGTLDTAAATIVNPTPDDRIALQIARARHLLVSDPGNAPAAVHQMAVDALALQPPQDPADTTAQAESTAQLRLLDELGGLSMVTGDLPTATQVFERLREANPGDARSRMMLFDLALRTQPQETLDAAELAAFQTAQFERLRLLIDEISQIPGMTFLSEYGRAVQLVLEFDAAGAGTAVGDRPEELTRDMLQRLDKAQAHLDTAGQARRKWNRLWHLRGEVHDRRQNILNAVGDQLWTKEFEAATDAYREAFECGLRTPEFVAKMLAYLYRAGRYVDAAQALTSLQAGQTPSLVSVAQTAAELSDQLGDSDRWSLDTLAIDAARQAAEGTGHDDPSVQLAYGNILLWHEQADEAAQVFQRVRDLAPKDLGLWQQLMIALRRIDALRQSKTPDAPSTLEQTLRDTLAAAQLVLSKPDFGVLAGNAYQLLGDRVEARARYVEELAAVPADLRQATASQVELLSEAAAFFLQEAGSNAESAQIVDTLLKRLDTEGATVYRELRDARREQGNRGEITPLERQLAVAVPVARRHMATMTMGRSDVASLEAALAALGRNREIRYTDEDKRIEALIKSRWNTRERREEGISLLASILSGSLVPLATDRLLLATMHLAEYQSLEEERALRELAYGEADPEVVLLAAAAKRHLTAAREQSRVIILSGSRGSADPGEAAATSVDGAYLAALSQQIEILLSSQETADAEFYLEKLKQAAPGSPSTTVLEARVKFALGQHDEVRALLQKLVEGAAPENRVGAMASIAQLLEGFGTQSGDASQPPGADYFGAAEQLLQQVAQDGPDQRMLLASYYGRRGRTAEGLELIAAEAATARQLELANACAQVMRGIGRDADKMQAFDEVLTTIRVHYPDSPALKLLQADVRTWQGDATTAETLYREILVAAPTHVIAANNLAYLLASQKKDLDEALQLIDAAIEKRGNMPDLLDTRAYVRLRRGEHQLALLDLGIAIGRKPAASFLLHDAEAKLAAGRNQEAKQALELAERAGLAEDNVHPAERESYLAVRSQLHSL